MLAAMTHRIDTLDNKKRSYCNCTYLSWLKKYNITTILISDMSSLHKVVDMCDMLILGGGYDVHPSFYGQYEVADYPHYDKTLDLLDFALLKAFHYAHKPILGICRGMQVINVYFKGTLYPHIPHHDNDVHSLYFHANATLAPHYPTHYISNSHHHQAIDRLGSCLHVEAVAKDGIIEAISFDDYIIGVQWHPELMDEDPIIPYFLSLLKDI